MTEERTREQVAQNAWRSWITARELKRADPFRSKKDCWRYANEEWLERRRYKRK